MAKRGGGVRDARTCSYAPRDDCRRGSCRCPGGGRAGGRRAARRLRQALRRRRSCRRTERVAHAACGAAARPEREQEVPGVGRSRGSNRSGRGDRPCRCGRSERRDGRSRREGRHRSSRREGRHRSSRREGRHRCSGAKGDTGAAGLDGVDGLHGTNGVDGAPGAKGDKGDTGNTGAAGTNGSNGADGAPGAKGDKGDTGAPGAKGDKGDKGEAAAYSPIVDINPILRPSRSHQWDRAQINGNSWFNGYRSSFPNGTDESYLEWDIPLQAGTWTIDVVYVKAHDAGILSLSLGGDEVGPEIDAYSPIEDGIDYNQVATFSSVDVATTGIHTLRIKTAAKNPASADYFGYLTWIRLVRE